MLALLLLACAEDPVLLQGTVYASPLPGADVLAGAEIRLVSAEEELLAEASTNSSGQFEVEVPSGVVFAEISADGYAVTTFPGTIGASPTQIVEDGALYGISEAERQAEIDAFSGCPGMTSESALVLGEIRIDITDTLTGGSPTTGTGVAEVQRNGESAWLGCYLDGDGNFDPEAVFTGATGRFLVGGVEPGIYDLEVSAQISEGLWTTASYPLWIPDRPLAISPWYPAFVPLSP